MPRDITPSRNPKTHPASPEVVFDQVKLTTLIVRHNDLKARFDLTDGSVTDYAQSLTVQIQDLSTAPQKLQAAWDTLANQLARHYTVAAIQKQISELEDGEDATELERDLAQALVHI
jgi:hypothetical protein